MLWQWHREMCKLLITIVLFYQPILADDVGLSTIEVDNFGRTALHRAALEGKYELVHQLISVMSFHINTRDHHGATPLFLAVIYAPGGGTINALIDNQMTSTDVDPHWSDTAFVPPPNWESTAIILLENGADVSIRNFPDNGDTVFHIAALKRMIKVIGFICKKFPTAISTENHLGETPIFSAVRSHSVKAVECVLGFGAAAAEDSDHGDWNLQRATAFKSPKVARIVDVANQKGQTPIVLAAKLNYWNIVSYLAKQGADPMISTHSRETLLHIAAKHGRINVIDFICKEFPTAINSENHLGETPIFGAVRSQSVEAVECVLGYGGAAAEESDIGNWNLQRAPAFKSTKIEPIIDAQNQSGSTPILVAAELEYWNIVSYLLEQGADPMISTQSRDTLLHIAAERGQIEVINFICEKFAMTITAQDPFRSVEAVGCVSNVGWHAQSADHKSVDVNEAIFRDLRVDSLAINSKNRNGDTPLLVAMKWGQQFAAEALLGHGADKTVTGQHGRTPLHCAVVNRWAGIAEKLLFNADRTNINAQDDFQKTPLCRAVSMFKSSPDPQTIVMVQTLLQNGADQTIPDESEYTPLQIAALCHMVEMVTLLVKFANPNIINAKNPKEQTALHLVFEMCKPFHDPKIVKIVEILVENGADPTIPDRYLNTALHYAAQCSFAENAKILLDWAKLSGKRIINAPNWQGKTALHLAIHSTGDLGDELRIEMIIVLLEFGANPWIGDDLGKTPVHYAAQISSIGITKLLLQDTDLSYINLQDLDLQTPLHLAVNDMFNDAKIGQMFDYLRSKGADPGLRDRNGHSPSDLFKRLRKNSRVYAFRTAMCSFGNRLVSQFRKFP